MGVCQSSEPVTLAAEGNYEESPEYQEDANHRRMTVAKSTTGSEQVSEFVEGEREKPETDFFEFEAEEQVEGEQFMAVKPWIGAIKTPDPEQEVNKDVPDETYMIEHVYGYRCEDSRQNVFYNPDDNVVYPTACLGVILDKEANTQTFFGGGEVENKSKQVQSSANSHSDDVMCMKINPYSTRQWVVSGQVGKSPAIFVWDSITGEKRTRFNLAKNARAVAACAICPKETLIAVADKHNDHNITIFNIESGDTVFTCKGGPDAIMDLTFSNNREGSHDLWAAGVKQMLHINIAEGKKKKVLFGEYPRTSFACCTSDTEGHAFGGAANGLIYRVQGNTVVGTIDKHQQDGFVGAIVHSTRLIAGSKGGLICLYNTDGGGSECMWAFSVGSLPRAIDMKMGQIIVGLRNGNILELEVERENMVPKVVHQSHNDGEVWGLSSDGTFVYTTGDDNQVKCWNPATRECVSTSVVSNEVRKAKKNRASTLGSKPGSQSARAIAISCNGDLAVCANDGAVHIRNCQDPNTVICEIQDSEEWIEVAEYSPDGNYLAVGSHDTNIYVYDVANGHSLIGKCTKHGAALTCIDWSQDSSYIRSVCNAYELLFFTIPDCNQDPSGASNTTSTVWASQHCKFGWCVDGVFPKGTDGTHINGVDCSENQSLIAAGDDFGLLQLFRNPCRKGSKPRSFRAHSEHVVRVRFGRGDLADYIFSVGGYDQTLIQWKKC